MDGFKADDFWDECENEGKTFTFIKTVEGKRFGGYRTVHFSKTNGPKRDESAFIFKLEEGNYFRFNQKNDKKHEALWDH